MDISVHWGALSPILILLGSGLLAITFSSVLPAKSKLSLGPVAAFLGGLGGLLACAILWLHINNTGDIVTIADTVRVDRMGLFISGLICAAVALASLTVGSYLRRERLDRGAEIYVLLLLSAAGGCIMATANDLIVLFMGLETLSLAAYILASIHLRRSESQESGMKYFVLGAFASAFFLYGIALIYGAAGSTKLVQITAALSLGNAPVDDGLLLAGIALLLVGFLFKVAAVPFHTWTPDVYEGAPSPVVAFMASAVKAAGFVALIRVLGGALLERADDWQPIIYVVAIGSMAVGSLAAIVQTNVKRILAYSSISHAGYILIGIQAGTSDGFAASLWYLAAYAMLAIGSFTVTSVSGGDFSLSSDNHDIKNYRGMAYRRPALVVVFTILLLAQTGIPPTSGFFAKFSVISAVVDERSYPLAAVAMVLAVVAAFVYLRLLVVMYFSDPPDVRSLANEGRLRPIPKGVWVVLSIAALFTLGMGVYPDPLLDMARSATQVLV